MMTIIEMTRRWAAIGLLCWSTAAGAQGMSLERFDAPAPSASPAAGKSGATVLPLRDMQRLIKAAKLDGWLLYDDHGTNPLAARLVQPTGNPARWFVLVPGSGDPQLLVHHADRAAFAAAGGHVATYRGWRDLDGWLKTLLKGARKVAMEYSPKAALPYFSRVDAGTLEQVRAAGATVVSSADLWNALEATRTASGRPSLRAAAQHLDEARAEIWQWLGDRLRRGESVDEADVARELGRSIAERGLETSTQPLVAAGARTADPEHRPLAGDAGAIKRGDLITVQLFARTRPPVGSPVHAIYTELAATGFAGEAVPAPLAEAFAALVKARDRALELLKQKVTAGQTIRGFELDAAAQAVLAKAGQTAHVQHWLGHSLGAEPLGETANADDFDTHDERPLLSGTGLALEPGLYAAGQWGLRTGVSVWIGEREIEVGSEPQRAIELLLPASAAPGK